MYLIHHNETLSIDSLRTYISSFRVRFTVGDNGVDYLGTVNTPTAELQTVKLYLNSVISDVTVSYCTLDIKKKFKLTY